ncbi:MAG: hypothetical protein ACR2MW_05740 [Chthoniobacterales bacterium]
MKNKSLRNWGGALYVALAACVFVTVTGWLLAAPSPSQEIIHAVAANGKNEVKTAAPDAFIYAFTSVLVNTEREQSGAYVAAAQSLRPDLSGRIAATAAEVDGKPSNGDGDGDGDNDGDGDDVSPHRRKCPVCHRTGRDRDDDHDGDHDKDKDKDRDGDKDHDKDKGKDHDKDNDKDHDKDKDKDKDKDGDRDDDKDRDRDNKQHTIFIPCKQVDKYLANHPRDRRGRCPKRDDD